MGLACTKTQNAEHRQLVVSVFNSHRDADEQITLNGKPFLQGLNAHRDAGEQTAQEKSLQEMRYNFWRATRIESVRSAAAAALIRLGVAGRQGMPSIRDTLRDIDRNIDESSLPGAQQLKELPEEFRKELRAAAVELLNDPDEHLRAVAARVIADLWLAGNEEGAAATALRESARNHGDAEAFKSLLLIAHADNTSRSLKSELKELFKTSLTQDQEAKRRGAIVALGSLYVKDESPRIRSNVTTYIPVLLDKDFAKELAPILVGVYRSVAAEGAKAEQLDVTDKKTEILKALGFLRAEAGTQIPDIIASEDLRPNQLRKEALNAAARSGPFQLQGVCRLLEVSAKDAANEAPMRAVAYYVSNNDETARLLISTLGPASPADRSLPASETEDRLWAILATLKECKGSAGLRDELGSRTVELVNKLEGKKNSELLHKLAEQYKDTSFAGELSRAAGPAEPGMIRWYHVLLLIVIIGFIFMQIACARKPLRRLHWYGKIPEKEIPIPNFPLPLPLRPLARLVLRPYSKRVLDVWVEDCVSKVRVEYALSCSKMDAWPDAVRINGVRLSRLETKKLRNLFSKTQVYTAVKGKNGQRRTKLACLLGWWAMAAQPGERLCEHLMLPVMIRASSDLLTEKQKEQDLLLEEIKTSLWRLVMDEDKLDEELLRQLMKRRRVLVIIDGFETGDEYLIGRFVARLDQYPANARIITSPKNNVFDPLPKDIISIDA